MSNSIGKVSLQLSASPTGLISGLSAGMDGIKVFAADALASLEKVSGGLAGKVASLSAPFAKLTAPLGMAESALKGFFGNFFNRERASEIKQLARMGDSFGLTTEQT